MAGVRAANSGRLRVQAGLEIATAPTRGLRVWLRLEAAMHGGLPGGFHCYLGDCNKLFKVHVRNVTALCPLREASMRPSPSTGFTIWSMCAHGRDRLYGAIMTTSDRPWSAVIYLRSLFTAIQGPGRAGQNKAIVANMTGRAAGVEWL
jgi:hypothetical protein